MGSITNIWETGVNNIQNGTNNHYYYITDDSSSLIKRLTIQSGTGTVGIDKNDPISITNTNVKLDVNGSINLSGNIYKNGILYVSNSTTWIENETKTKIYYMSGNVGINNSNPLELLDVNGNIKAINIIANGSGLTNLNADNIEYGKLTDNLFDSNINITGNLTVGELEVLGLSSSSIINTKNLEIINNNNTSNPSLIINHNSTFNDLLKISSTNNSRIFTILKDGNVGIGGTAFPNSNYKLDVDGNINSSGTISSQIVLIKDSINLYKSSTQSVLIKLPQTLTSYTITLPNTGPLANNILKSDDNGNLSWVNINDSLTLINIYSFFDSTEFEITTNIKLKNINSSKLLSAFNNNQFELPPNGEPQIIRIKDSILTSLQNVQNFNITSINDPPENTINTLNLELNNITNEPSIIYPKIKKIKLQGVSGDTCGNADIREFEFGGLGGWGSGNRKSGSYEINVTTNFITSQYPASPIVTTKDWVNGSNVAADPNSPFLENIQNVTGKYIQFDFVGSAPLPYINELINFKIYYDRADISDDGEEGTYNFIAIDESNIEYNLFTFTISENNIIKTPNQYYVNYDYTYNNSSLSPKIIKIKLRGISGTWDANPYILEYDFKGLGIWEQGNRSVPGTNNYIKVTENGLSMSPYGTNNLQTWVNGGKILNFSNDATYSGFNGPFTYNGAQYVLFDFQGSAVKPYLTDIQGLRIWYDRKDISISGNRGTHQFIAIDENNNEHIISTYTINESNIIENVIGGQTYRYVDFNFRYKFTNQSISPQQISNMKDNEEDYRYLKFTHSGKNEDQTQYNLNISENTTCDILIVAGGGAGGTYIGGGGGGGGVLYITNAIIPAGTYTIKVGKGGDRVVGNEYIKNNNNGRNSEAFGIVVNGGGAGGTGGWAGQSNGQNGANGGSGGGGGSSHNGKIGSGGTKLNADITNSQITLTTYQNYGGNGAAGMNYPGSLVAVAANGGGGAGGNASANNNQFKAGAGADGIQINIDGNNYYWGGGGGGGSFDGIGGNGGKGGGGGGNASEAGNEVGLGGIGGITLGQNGNSEGNGIGGDGGPGTGGGGGGSGNTDERIIAISGAGGSGIVIIRYRKSRNYTIDEINCSDNSNIISNNNTFNNNFNNLFDRYLFDRLYNNQNAIFDNTKYNILNKTSLQIDPFEQIISGYTKRYYILSTIIKCNANSNTYINISCEFQKRNNDENWINITDNNMINKISYKSKIYLYGKTINDKKDSNITEGCNSIRYNNITNNDFVFSVRCDIIILNNLNMDIKALIDINLSRQNLSSNNIENFTLYEGFNLEYLHNSINNYPHESVYSYYRNNYDNLNKNLNNLTHDLNNNIKYYRIPEKCDELNRYNNGYHNECDLINKIDVNKLLLTNALEYTNNYFDILNNSDNIPNVELITGGDITSISDCSDIINYITEEQQIEPSMRVPRFTPGGYSLYFKISY